MVIYMGKSDGLLRNVKRHLDAIATGLKYLATRPRLTIMYPEVVEDLPDGYRGMLTFDPKKCIGCSLCARICPANAIKMYKVDEKKRRPGVNYTRCIFCGFCVDICPTGALQHSKIHDVSYYTFKEQIYEPWRLEKGPPKPYYPKEPRKARVEFDEVRGLRYELE